MPEPPPLGSGDHLSRAEFERGYEAHPEIRKAELIIRGTAANNGF